MNRSQVRTEDDFNALFVDSIAEGLALVLGVEGAKSVTFYLDPHIAVADPDIYAASVTKLLGKPTEPLFEAILDNLRRMTGISKGDAKAFAEGVADAKRKFQQRRRTKS